MHDATRRRLSRMGLDDRDRRHSTECEQDGNSASIAVIDRAGRIKIRCCKSMAARRITSSLPAARPTPRARSRCRPPTGRSATEMLPESSAQRMLERRHRCYGGGMPIKVGNETIGAIGSERTRAVGQATRNAPRPASTRSRIS